MAEDNETGPEAPDLMDELDELERLRLLGALDDPAAGRRLHALASQVEGQTVLPELPELLRDEDEDEAAAPRRGMAWPTAIAAVVGAAALGVAVGRWSPQVPGGEGSPNPAQPSSQGLGHQPSPEPAATLLATAPSPLPSALPSPMAKPSATPPSPAPSPRPPAAHAALPSAALSPGHPPSAKPSAPPVAPPSGPPSAGPSTRPMARPSHTAHHAAQPSPRPHRAWPSAGPSPLANQHQAAGLPSPEVLLPNHPSAHTPRPSSPSPHVASHPAPVRTWAPAARPQGQGQAPAWPISHAPMAHVVQPGESLWAIAEAQSGQGEAWQALWAANRDLVAKPNLIHPGQRLRLPTRRAGAPRPSLPLASASSVVVAPGDSLSRLAWRHSGRASNWPLLWRANRQQVPLADLIYPGQRLSLPWARGGAVPAAAPTWKPQAHQQLRRSRAAWVVVKEGDTLWAIAKRGYGTGLAWRRIQALNRHRIASPEALVPGTLLRLR